MSLPYVHFVKYRYNITDSVVVTRNVEAIFGNCSTPAVKLRYIVNPNKDGYKMVTSQLFYPNFTRKTKPIRRRSYLHYGFEMVKFDINLTNFMLSATFEGVSATANGGQFAMLPHCDMSTVDKEIIYEFEFVLGMYKLWLISSLLEFCPRYYYILILFKNHPQRHRFFRRCEFKSLSSQQFLCWHCTSVRKSSNFSSYTVLV